jgi:sugar lactone lactonase YvrE
MSDVSKRRAADAPTLRAEIEAELTVQEVQHIHGVTFDGKSVWFAADKGDLLELDPVAGTIRTRTNDLGTRAGITFDGMHLWVICGKEIRKLDRATRKVISSIPNPSPEPSGMAWAEGALWIGNHEQILKVDPADGRVLKRVTVERFVTGVTWAEGELWHGAEGPHGWAGGLVRVDPNSGAETLRLECTTPTEIAGIEYDATRGVFWCAACEPAPRPTGIGKLHAIRKPR